MLSAFPLQKRSKSRRRDAGRLFCHPELRFAAAARSSLVRAHLIGVMTHAGPSRIVAASIRERAPAGEVELDAIGADAAEGGESMSTTAWRFRGTEGADDAVLRLKQLDAQDVIDVQDVAVLRWPLYAAEPQAQEHVTSEGSKVSSLAKKLRHTDIDNSMVESVKGDMIPGTSALVLLSSDAAIGAVVKAFEGQDMELVRSDLSVQQQDQIRAAFGDPAMHPGQPPGNVPKER
jgi:uncharacterized membrane protein